LDTVTERRINQVTEQYVLPMERGCKRENDCSYDEIARPYEYSLYEYGIGRDRGYATTKQKEE